ncbi:carboxypeptidase regulatory-like domain-containing protein [Granulicella sp. S156]|uniref:carboxypeptidase regulatory-like domain-containing protein n=1 Tax=Granulicella sp. S156 TaxID=1747224 RepID=UPI0020B14DF9|nr:carboxypeptidase regulatory-like domain-containing protein [Granulicella sp. S156]
MAAHRKISIAIKQTVTLQLFLMFFFCALLVAQTGTSAISGRIIDPSGGLIQDAQVTVTDEATGVKTELHSNGDGIYSAEALGVGFYSIRVAKGGFSPTITSHIHLDPGERRTNDVTLKLGTESTSVNVDANALQVNTQTAENGGTINEQQIDNLMLNGRDFQTMALAIPGVASPTGADQSTVSNNILITVNGAGTETSTQILDGIYNMNSGSLNGINAKPIVDGISEFTVLKDNYGAQYGMSSSSVVVVVTKSGGSKLHGSAWEYVRNNDFDADGYFAKTTPPLHQNIFGYSLGGPVVIPHVYNGQNKTFFFASNQWYRISQGVTLNGAVLTDDQRAGNFNGSASLRLCGTAPCPLSLDSGSVALLASEGKTNCIIANTNTVNPSCFDPVAVAMLNTYFPTANNSSNGFQNYLNQGSQQTDETDYQYRIDHHITGNELLTGRVIYDRELSNYPYQTWGGVPFNTITDNEPFSGMNAFVRLQSTVTPNLLNTFTVAQTYDKLSFSLTKGGTMPSGVSITQAFPNANVQNYIPTINISGGYTSLSVTEQPIWASDGEGMLMDDVSWVHGRHVVSAGGLYMFGIKRQYVFTNPEGSFSFTGNHTNDPAADFLLGLDSNYSQASTQKLGAFHYRQGEAYVQDIWKATSRLTLSAGIRWQYFSNDTVSGDQVTSFDPSQYNAAQAPVVNIDGSLTVNAANQPLTSAGTVANTLNGLVYAGKNGVPDGFFTPKKDNFGPRVGFAYDVFGNSKDAIRGGYGIGYSRIPVEQIYNAFGQNPPYNQSANILNSLLSNGTAGGVAQAPTTQTLNNVPLSFTPTDVQSYSLTLEHQVKSDIIATVGYAGSASRHLMTFQGGYDFNFPLPVTAPSTTGCLAAQQTASASYNFDPCINASKASSDYTRPYKGYSTMDNQYQQGTANYNSLQSSLSWRGHPLQLTVAYTYSKTLTTVGAHGTQANSGQSAQAQNSRDFHLEYGPPSYDFTNDISMTWIYDLPKLRGSNWAVRSVLGNWSFAGLFLHQSGFALSPGLSVGDAGLAIRPNQIAPFKKVGNVKEWFDTTRYQQPAYGFFGDASNGSIRSPGYTTANVSLNKAFPIIHDKAQFQLSAEAFNVANHTNFVGVDTGVGSGSYGQLTSAGDPRILEFSGKFKF